jgi:RimJ/RimL family protein N-acetyltransferase
VTDSLPIDTDRLTRRRYLESDYDDLLKLQSNDDVTRFLILRETGQHVGEAVFAILAEEWPRGGVAEPLGDC